MLWSFIFNYRVKNLILTNLSIPTTFVSNSLMFKKIVEGSVTYVGFLKKIKDYEANNCIKIEFSVGTPEWLSVTTKTNFCSSRKRIFKFNELDIANFLIKMCWYWSNATFR